MGRMLRMVLSVILLTLAAAAVAGAMMWALNTADPVAGATENYRPKAATAQGMHYFYGMTWTAHGMDPSQTPTSSELGVVLDLPPRAATAGGEPVDGETHVAVADVDRTAHRASVGRGRHRPPEE